ncbi:Fic family protein [Bradyrhizobium stylosanthis]|uniref:Fic family protein n=1 Tax=Bradyrhizobium stylosanthis TaxID=1803665 RepID=A0A560CX17_9BRAD|nr:Fic family protein [Bradyrhizobium stylosanthis]TWA89395.1 Fic family protein [Bradyrhizobium stylosanthis]
MPRNWEESTWPQFTYDAGALEPLEAEFLLRSGEFIGAFKHVRPDDQENLRIELISEEALKTSEIEGEILNRDSVQSSLRHQFGLGDEQAGVPPAERGIAQMMVDLYLNFSGSLTDETMFGWHGMLMSGDRTIKTIGAYRTHPEPMQVVSGAIGRRKVHFEAPPSDRMAAEMGAFIKWFNDSGPDGTHPLPTITRSALAHLYFVSVHPFEDGNGRIARALAEKSLAQNLGQPTLIALAYTIERKRKAYYEALERNNKNMEITDWLLYFGGTILEAQENTNKRVDFYIAKTKFYERLRGQFNDRQEKVIGRMFKEGIDGFKGGLSAENYITITKAPRATTTRDLQDLVAKGALTRTGELRHTRYHLNLSDPTAPVRS